MPAGSSGKNGKTKAPAAKAEPAKVPAKAEPAKAEPGKQAAAKAKPAAAPAAAADRGPKKRHRIVLLTGDGTGPELAETTRKVIDATGVAIDWVEAEAGVEVHAREGTPLPQRTLDA